VGINVTMTNVGNLLYNAMTGNTNTGLLDSQGNSADSPLDLPHSEPEWNHTLNPGQSEGDMVQFCVSIQAQPAQMNIGLDENATDIGVWLLGSQKTPTGITTS
jgi:hypothetical protein